MQRRRVVWAIATVVAVWAGVSSGQQQRPPAAAKSEAELKARVDEALGTVQRRYLTIGVHTPWQIAHGILALGDEMQLKEQNGRLVGALDYFCRRATLRGQPILQPTDQGLRFISADETEGHPDQFLGYFAQAGVPIDTVLQVGERTYTVADLVQEAQADVGQHGETSWTLTALSYYLGPKASWKNRSGQRYSVEGLLKWELQQSVESGACGGTHRLSALTTALGRYKETGQPLAGVWKSAEERIERYLALARNYQNSDGSFSSEFFEGPGWTGNLEDRLHAHGHTLEWVVTAVDKEELSSGWITRAVTHLSDTLLANRRQPIECGALYHGARGLAVYRDRHRGTAERPSGLAKKAAPGRSDPPAAEGQ